MAAGGDAPEVLFAAPEVVVDGKVGVGRAGWVLKAPGHVGRAFYPLCEVLDVKVGEHVVDLFTVEPLGVYCVHDLVDGPPDNLVIVPVVSKERNCRGYCLDAAVKGRGGNGERAALAFAVCHHVSMSALSRVAMKSTARTASAKAPL